MFALTYTDREFISAMKLTSTSLSGALLGILLATGQIQAATIIEYRFNESGGIATNTGTLGASGNGVTW